MFDGLGKTLDCMPAAHGSGTSVVQGCIGRIVLWVDDRRHQLCCQKGFVLLIDCSETVSHWISFSWMASFSCCSFASWNATIACPVLDVSHTMSTSLVHSNSRMDPNLDLSNRHR